MKMISRDKKIELSLFMLALFAMMSLPAYTLDAYQDRRGFFVGAGLGGGGAFQNGEPGGALALDLQLGGGASKNLTFALDTELWFHLMDDHSNLLITPGPEVNYFFGNTGLYAAAGMGMALTFVWIDDVSSGGNGDDQDFAIGFDGSIGAGWEFFGNASFAFGLGIEADYIALKGDDIVSVGFMVNLRHY